MDAVLKAGQVVDPLSDTQVSWAIAAGREAARMERRAALFFAVLGCFWRVVLCDRQQLSAWCWSRGRSLRRHWRMLSSVYEACRRIMRFAGGSESSARPWWSRVVDVGTAKQTRSFTSPSAATAIGLRVVYIES